ncbi:hypothetical protein ACPA9J_34195 [Pseudomonas aeruginosa]
MLQEDQRVPGSGLAGAAGANPAPELRIGHASRRRTLEALTTQPGRRRRNTRGRLSARRPPQCPFALPERFVGIDRREQQRATPRVLARSQASEYPPGRAERASCLQGPGHPRSRRGTPRPALASRYAVAPPGRPQSAPGKTSATAPRRMQQRRSTPSRRPRGRPRTTLSEGAQVGHFFEQRLGRQQQGLAGHLGQVVLDQRQLRAATQRLAAPSQAAAGCPGDNAQQADGAALEKVARLRHGPASNPAASSSTPGFAFAAPAIDCMFVKP